MWLDPALQASEIKGAALAGDFASVLENGQGGNAADVESASELLFVLGIQFGQSNIGFKIDRCLMKIGGHHLAGVMPSKVRITI